MTLLAKNIQKELKELIDPSYDGYTRFFKEPIKAYGLRYGNIKVAGKVYWKEVKELDKQELISLCEELLDTGYVEPKHLAFNYAYKQRKLFDKKDFDIFERWLYKYVNDWALCDSYAPKMLNYYIQTYPELIPRVKDWAYSSRTYVRRAAAVSFLSDALRMKENPHDLKDIFDVCTRLMFDKEDLVLKGYGWLLKNASKKYRQEVFDFLMKHKKEMPRTAFRYALEKMPNELRRKAMSK